MKNPQDKTHPSLVAESLAEDFLDHFCAPLVGFVPYAERHVLRRELASHLDALAMEFEWQGEDPAQAIRSALCEMGEPWASGEAWLAEWQVGREAKASPRPAMVAFARPFAFFGAATMLNLLVLEYYLVPANGIAIHPALPIPVFLLMVLSPVLAGILSGYRQSARLLMRPLRFVLLFLTLDSLLTGLLMQPEDAGVSLAVVQLVVWIPIGLLASYGTARLTAPLVRSHRRRSFLRLVEGAE